MTPYKEDFITNVSEVFVSSYFYLDTKGKSTKRSRHCALRSLNLTLQRLKSMNVLSSVGRSQTCLDYAESRRND